MDAGKAGDRRRRLGGDGAVMHVMHRAAGDADRMGVGRGISVEPGPGANRGYPGRDAAPGKCVEGAIDGVEGDGGKHVPDFAVNSLGVGMIGRVP